MKFVLVNHRTPLNRSSCAACSKTLGSGYLKAVSTQRAYCDHDCYLRGESTSLSISWLATTPFEMMASFAAASSCYSMEMARAALRMSEVMAAELQAASGGGEPEVWMKREPK